MCLTFVRSSVLIVWCVFFVLHEVQPVGAAGQDQGRASAQRLLPVALPDLSRVNQTVRDQLRAAHAVLISGARSLQTVPTDRANAFGEMGMLFMAARFPEEAQRCFRNAQQLALNDARWPYYLGHSLKNEGDFSGAADSFERVRQLRPMDLATLVWLGRVHLDLGEPMVAEARLREALSVHPDEPVVQFELGRAALEQQDYSRAVDRLTAVLSLSPEATVIHYPLAMAYRGVGDLEKATHHMDLRGGRDSRGYSSGVALRFPDPLMVLLNGAIQTPQLHRDRGLNAASRQDWSEAVTNFRQAVAVEPDYAAMRLNLGTALERVGDARGALDQYEAALRLEPQLPEAHYGLGDLFERSGRDQEAIEQFQKAVMQNPNFLAAHLKLADALRRTDQLEEALVQYRRVIDLNPGDVGARFGEAMALVRLHRYQEAEDRFTEAMQVRADQPMFRHALARLLAAAPDDSVRDGERAWALVVDLPEEQQHPGVFETMAMALAELGHFELAIDWQRLAMSVTATAGRSDIAQQMAATLALYARQQPSRTPWRPDDPDHRPGPVVDLELFDDQDQP